VPDASPSLVWLDLAFGELVREVLRELAEVG